MTNSDFGSGLDRTNATLDRLADLLERSAQRQEEQHNRLMAELREMRIVAEEQGRTIRQFVAVVAEQARTISDMLQYHP